MLFIATGGTIDKLPVYLPGTTTFDNNSKVFGETHLPEMLEKAKFQGPVSIKTQFLIDSLDMTDKNRQDLSKTIEDSTETEVVITHGTDTMSETARFLELNPNLAGKIIVLTGAMIPYSLGESSNAMFNLGCAMAYAQALPNGVYVAMNGQAFNANNVRKDVKAGIFKTL
jgi:L-asparaginase